MVFLLLADDD
jgi:hypothetical protein